MSCTIANGELFRVYPADAPGRSITVHQNSTPLDLSDESTAAGAAAVFDYAHVLKVWAGTLPGWVTGIGIFIVLAGLGWKALGQIGVTGSTGQGETDEPHELAAPPRTPAPIKTEELTIER